MPACCLVSLWSVHVSSQVHVLPNCEKRTCLCGSLSAASLNAVESTIRLQHFFRKPVGCCTSLFSVVPLASGESDIDWVACWYDGGDGWSAGLFGHWCGGGQASQHCCGSCAAAVLRSMYLSIMSLLLHSILRMSPDLSVLYILSTVCARPTPRLGYWPRLGEMADYLFAQLDPAASFVSTSNILRPLSY